MNSVYEKEYSTKFSVCQHFFWCLCYNLSEVMKMVHLTKRLRDLREDHDLTQEEVAKIVGNSKQRYGEWERGEHRPSIDAIITLAEFYKVSTDYILGLTNDPRRN